YDPCCSCFSLVSSSDRCSSPFLFLLCFFILLLPSPPPPSSTLFPYTTLFRSEVQRTLGRILTTEELKILLSFRNYLDLPAEVVRSEEHTSELQSRFDLVCRLLLEKKKLHPVIQTLRPSHRRQAHKQCGHNPPH